MYLPGFIVVKLLFDRIYLYIENELSTSTEVIGHRCIQHTSYKTIIDRTILYYYWVL